jgi:hypothetical protein
MPPKEDEQQRLRRLSRIGGSRVRCDALFVIRSNFAPAKQHPA